MLGNALKDVRLARERSESSSVSVGETTVNSNNNSKFSNFMKSTKPPSSATNRSSPSKENDTVQISNSTSSNTESNNDTRSRSSSSSSKFADFMTKSKQPGDKSLSSSNLDSRPDTLSNDTSTTNYASGSSTANGAGGSNNKFAEFMAKGRRSSIGQESERPYIDSNSSSIQNIVPPLSNSSVITSNVDSARETPSTTTSKKFNEFVKSRKSTQDSATKTHNTDDEEVSNNTMYTSNVSDTTTQSNKFTEFMSRSRRSTSDAPRADISEVSTPYIENSMESTSLNNTNTTSSTTTNNMIASTPSTPVITSSRNRASTMGGNTKFAEFMNKTKSNTTETVDDTLNETKVSSDNTNVHPINIPTPISSTSVPVTIDAIVPNASSTPTPTSVTPTTTTTSSNKNSKFANFMNKTRHSIDSTNTPASDNMTDNNNSNSNSNNDPSTPTFVEPESVTVVKEEHLHVVHSNTSAITDNEPVSRPSIGNSKFAGFMSKSKTTTPSTVSNTAAVGVAMQTPIHTVVPSVTPPLPPSKYGTNTTTTTTTFSHSISAPVTSATNIVPETLKSSSNSLGDAIKQARLAKQNASDSSSVHTDTSVSTEVQTQQPMASSANTVVTDTQSYTTNPPSISNTVTSTTTTTNTTNSSKLSEFMNKNRSVSNASTPTAQTVSSGTSNSKFAQFMNKPRRSSIGGETDIHAEPLSHNNLTQPPVPVNTPVTPIVSHSHPNITNTSSNSSAMPSTVTTAPVIHGSATVISDVTDSVAGRPSVSNSNSNNVSIPTTSTNSKFSEFMSKSRRSSIGGGADAQESTTENNITSIQSNVPTHIPVTTHITSMIHETHDSHSAMMTSGSATVISDLTHSTTSATSGQSKFSEFMLRTRTRSSSSTSAERESVSTTGITTLISPETDAMSTYHSVTSNSASMHSATTQETLSTSNTNPTIATVTTTETISTNQTSSTTTTNETQSTQSSTDTATTTETVFSNNGEITPQPPLPPTQNQSPVTRSQTRSLHQTSQVIVSPFSSISPVGPALDLPVPISTSTTTTTTKNSKLAAFLSKSKPPKPVVLSTDQSVESIVPTSSDTVVTTHEIDNTISTDEKTAYVAAADVMDTDHKESPSGIRTVKDLGSIFDKKESIDHSVLDSSRRVSKGLDSPTLRERSNSKPDGSVNPTATRIKEMTSIFDKNKSKDNVDDDVHTSTTTTAAANKKDTNRYESPIPRTSMDHMPADMPSGVKVKDFTSIFDKSKDSARKENISPRVQTRYESPSLRGRLSASGNSGGSNNSNDPISPVSNTIKNFTQIYDQKKKDDSSINGGYTTQRTSLSRAEAPTPRERSNSRSTTPNKIRELTALFNKNSTATPRGDVMDLSKRQSTSTSKSPSSTTATTTTTTVNSGTQISPSSDPIYKSRNSISTTTDGASVTDTTTSTSSSTGTGSSTWASYFGFSSPTSTTNTTTTTNTDVKPVTVAPSTTSTTTANNANSNAHGMNTKNVVPVATELNESEAAKSGQLGNLIRAARLTRSDSSPTKTSSIPATTTTSTTPSTVMNGSSNNSNNTKITSEVDKNKYSTPQKVPINTSYFTPTSTTTTRTTTTTATNSVTKSTSSPNNPKISDEENPKGLVKEFATLFNKNNKYNTMSTPGGSGSNSSNTTSMTTPSTPISTITNENNARRITTGSETARKYKDSELISPDRPRRSSFSAPTYIHCPVCTKPIYPMDAHIKLDKTSVHTSCARCSECTCIITLMNYSKVEIDGKFMLLCKTHYMKRTYESGRTYESSGISC